MMTPFLAALARRPLRPVSAHSGRKEFIDKGNASSFIQVDAVLSADTAAP
jgi:hypothetical protein